jgi:hypothetical protein
VTGEIIDLRRDNRPRACPRYTCIARAGKT